MITGCATIRRIRIVSKKPIKHVPGCSRTSHFESRATAWPSSCSMMANRCTSTGKSCTKCVYDHKLLMKLLAGRDREKYGEYKVVEVNWKDWDGDVSKLSPNA